MGYKFEKDIEGAQKKENSSEQFLTDSLNLFLDLTWLRSILSFTSYHELIPSKVKNLLSIKIRSLQFVDLVAKRRSMFSSTTLGQDQPTQNFTKPPKNPEILASKLWPEEW